MRSLTVMAGLLLFALGCSAFLFAGYLTGEESSLPSSVKAMVLALAAGAVGMTLAGRVVAARGFAARSWTLFGGAFVMHVVWCGLALGVAETL